MSNNETKCPDCNRPAIWSELIWNIGIVKGYKTKVYKCPCGNEMSRFVPVSEEKKIWWKSILGN